VFNAFTINLTEANAYYEIRNGGHSFLVRRASSESAEIRVQIDGRAFADERLYKFGEGFRFVSFERLILSWDAQSGESVEVMTWGDPGGVCNEPEIYVSPITPES